MAGSSSHEQEAAPQGRGDVTTKTGTGRTCEVATCGLLVGASGPPGMSPQGTISSDLGMGRPGAAGSGEAGS